MSALLVAAAAGLVSGLVVAFAQHWFQQQAERKRERARRFADFAAASWATTLELGRLARAEMEEKAAIRADMEIGADRINTSEALILLMDDDAVYRAARAVDRCQAELKDLARDKMWDHDEWIGVREERLSPFVDEYYAAARRALGKPPSAFKFSDRSGAHPRRNERAGIREEERQRELER
jgi:hypothetical protein